MKRSFVFLSLLLIVVLVGCSNEAAGPTDGNSFDPFGLWSSTGAQTYGQLHITSMWYQKSDVVNYRSGGEIYSSLTTHDASTFVSGGTMVASNLAIPEVYTGAYELASGENGPTFGASTAWSLFGNSSAGIPAFSDNMYVPAEIRLTNPTASTVAISKSAPLTINWNTDSNNESVLVLIDYMVEESQMRDPNLTSTDYRWHIITDDDGSYTVSTSDLAGLQVGGVFQVTVARGISKMSGTTSHPFHIYAYTTATGMYAVSQ